MTKYFLLIVFFIYTTCSAQRDIKLNGYAEFKFGMNKNEIMKKLKQSKISYDTLQKGRVFINNNFIRYLDRADLGWEDVIMQIELYFDRRNENKLYEAIITIEKNKPSIEKAQELTGRLLEVLNEKYGNYDSTRSNMEGNDYLAFPVSGKSVEYYWGFPDGSLNLDANYFDFYVTDETRFHAYELSGYEGEVRLRLNYSDFNLEKLFFDNWIQESKDKSKKENEILKSKF